MTMTGDVASKTACKHCGQHLRKRFLDGFDHFGKIEIAIVTNDCVELMNRMPEESNGCCWFLEGQ